MENLQNKEIEVGEVSGVPVDLIDLDFFNFKAFLRFYHDKSLIVMFPVSWGGGGGRETGNAPGYRKRPGIRET